MSSPEKLQQDLEQDYNCLLGETNETEAQQTFKVPDQYGWTVKQGVTS